MRALTEKEVDLVSQRLHEQGISQPDLHTDLLDHFCCLLEQSEPHLPFEEVWRQALEAVAPTAGLHQLEEERFFLFHFKKQTTMNRLIFASGFITTFLLSFGLMFKTMHWFPANLLMGAGFVLLIITALILLAKAVTQLSRHTVAYRVRILFGIAAAVLIGTGSLFKLLHFPTANVQLVLGMALLNLVFLPLFFYQLYKQAQLRLT